MASVLVRLVFLTVGLGVTEIALTGIFGSGSLASWLLLIAIGLPLLVGGTLGFLTPMFDVRHDERTGS
jgi:L-cystine uptake protein TcyP (sodium:dicarboxylate symporter family)